MAPKNADITMSDDNAADGGSVRIDADWVACTAHDFFLDNAARRVGVPVPDPKVKPNVRRALVHDFSPFPNDSDDANNGKPQDRLILNYDGDYLGGVLVFEPVYIQTAQPDSDGNKFLHLTATKVDENLKTVPEVHEYINLVDQINALRLAVALLDRRLKAHGIPDDMGDT